MSYENEKITRKLRAILSADVKGYSLLMSDDEGHTIQTLKGYRSLMSDLIGIHSGRVVDNPGDNLLAEFSSAVNAVDCAVQIQNRLKKENAKFVEEKRLHFRIGVNIGDVVQDGEHIYGSGVNIAARIESLAEPGGICISRNAYDQIKDKLDYGYKYLGEHTVKNITEPVRVYKVLAAPEDIGELNSLNKKPSKTKWAVRVVAALFIFTTLVLGGIYWKYFYLQVSLDIDPDNEMTYALPAMQSVAILPFDNMTGDSEQDYFCDGFTEHIISTLSYSHVFLVIARNSSFAFRGKQKTVQEIGKELNANWIIEGSIQKYKERVRITVQLIDVASGHHKFSKTYDRESVDIFKLQDEIALEIIEEIHLMLGMGLGMGEGLRSIYDGVKTPQELQKIFIGRNYFLSGRPENIRLAEKELLEVIEMNPNIPYAYTTLCHLYIAKLGVQQCESSIVCLAKATEAVKKAHSLNEDFDMAYHSCPNVSV